jgi:putative alpha-1,2-mannosidase
MKIWFNAGPRGISGDEDNEEESSWYVFSAMGFFPVCPGRPVYDIGSPIFEETRLTVAGGKVFTTMGRNVSAADKYIQSATLNGKPLNKPWFEHSDIVNGGALVSKMGPRPNTAWGELARSAAAIDVALSGDLVAKGHCGPLTSRPSPIAFLLSRK